MTTSSGPTKAGQRSLPRDLRAAVLERAKQTPSPDLAATRRTRWLALAGGALLALASFAPFGPGLGGRPVAFVALSAAGWAAIAFATSFVARPKRSTMLGVARSLLVFAALAAAPAIFAWVMGCTAGWPDVRDRAGTLRAHVTCFLSTMLFSIGPLVALSLVRRGGDPVHPRATGAAIGAAAGAWGGVLVDLHCPLAGPLHVAIGHVLPVLVYAAIGAAVGSRWFGVRAPPER